MKKMRNHKQVPSRWLILMPICVCVFFLGSVLAYAAMVAEDKKVNNFQIGNLETKIDEVFTTPTSALKPGESHQKQVTIHNEGTIKQFIRVMVFPEIVSTAKGAAEARILPTEIGKEILLDIDPEKGSTANWKDGGDGYYYYLKALQPDETTEQLFSKVELSASVSKDYQNSHFVIQLKVESVACGKDAYLDAWWQGERPTAGNLKTIDEALQENVE